MTKEELFNQNIKLAYYFANRYQVSYPHDYEDIKQIALMGLWKAILKYDERAKFSTFAGIVIQNEINMYLRHIKKQNNMSRLEQEIGEKIILADIIASDEDELGELERQLDTETAKKHLDTEISKLNTRDREIYECLMRGDTQRQIASKVGISQPQVCRIRERIIKDTRLAIERCNA